MVAPPMMPPPPMMPGMDPMAGLAGPLPPPPDFPLGGDPFAAMNPPNPLMFLLADPEALRKLLNPPKRKKMREKWQRPPKPTEAEMLAKAHADRNHLAALNRRFEDNLARIYMEVHGAFDDFDPDAEKRWKSSALADENALIAAKVGKMVPAFESMKRRPFDDDESQAKEDLLAYLHEDFRRQHARAGYADLDIDMTKNITEYGRVCSQRLCNFKPMPGESPFFQRMIDPSFAYPTFQGRRGMTHMTLIYRQQLGEFIGDHDKDGKIEAELLSRRQDGTDRIDGRGRRYQLTDEGEVIEYWDCANFGLFFDGKLVKEGRHDYGEPPFVYTLAPYGPASFTRTPESRSFIDGYNVTMTPLDADISKRGYSHFWTRFETHAQREAIFGKMASAFAAWRNEPYWLAQDDTTYGKRPNWTRQPGAINFVRREHENLMPPPEVQLPATLGPLLSASNDDVSRSGLSPVDYGLAPAQTSGFAVGGMSEQSQQKLIPVIRTKEAHHAACAEQALRFFADFGDQLGEKGSKGEYQVPKLMPDKNSDPFWTVTPDMIDRTGWHVTVSLNALPDASVLTQLINAFGMARQQGVLSRREEIGLLGLPGSRNPDRAIREIDVERFKEMPEYQMADLLRWLVEEEGEPRLADFIAAQLAKGQMKEARQMAGSGPSGPMGQPPGGMSGQANAPGLSLPGLGMPPGQQGGRPPGQPGIGIPSGPPTEP